MEPGALGVVRDANGQIETFLQRYGSPSVRIEESVPDLAPLSEAVNRAGQALQGMRLQELDSTARAELDEYVRKLKDLNKALERLQPLLEARRDVIRDRLGKIRQALNWVDSFHQTRE
jgi:ABC-type transporter Mla subunit MlaD